MEMALLVQFLGSAVAVALLVGLAAWAGVRRPTPALDEAAARALLAYDFPDEEPQKVWLTEDGAAARAGEAALILYRLGDGYVARRTAWTKALARRLSQPGWSARELAR
jgi:hypothetical protein